MKKIYQMKIEVPKEVQKKSELADKKLKEACKRVLKLLESVKQY